MGDEGVYELGDGEHVQGGGRVAAGGCVGAGAVDGAVGRRGGGAVVYGFDSRTFSAALAVALPTVPASCGFFWAPLGTGTADALGTGSGALLFGFPIARLPICAWFVFPTWRPRGGAPRVFPRFGFPAVAFAGALIIAAPMGHGE
jgi:hypothetical protein